MKIGIDISQIAHPGTGVATYTTNLVNFLVKAGGDYVLFGSSLRQRKMFKTFPDAKTFPFPPTMLEFMWNQLHILSVENLIGKIDLFHSSDWTQPPTKAKKVTTVHDMVTYKFPETSHPSIIAAQRRRLHWVKKECDKIIAVSQATRDDIMKFLNIPEGKIKVIYEATTIKKSAISKKINNNRPYILAVGTREPRKNIDRLIQAFKKSKSKDLDLLIVGKYGWGNHNPGASDDNVKLLGYASPEELASYYSNAELFVYPSLYEGFGLPVLESFNCDCPVITSNTSSLPEVGGKAAIYVDPQNIFDIAEKIDWVLSLNSAKRSEIISAGRKQAEKFSWEKAAEETRKIYEELV